MLEQESSIAKQIARAAADFQQQRMGHPLESVTVVLSGDTLVVTLHGALTKAEKILAKTVEGAARVQEFHRQLFRSSCEPLCQKIREITGSEVKESTAEIGTSSGAVVQAFTNGTMVQVFLLAQKMAPAAWTQGG